MSNASEQPAHPAEMVADGETRTLEEVCLACRVDADWIATLVQEGAIEPIGRERGDWQFTSVTLVRVARARRLERDLSLNAPGVALALELLDEIDALRARLKALEGRR